MYTKNNLIDHIRGIGIMPTDTLLIHSSMKAIGEVEGGADTVLDAFIEYMEPGPLIFPTHTWAQINAENPAFNVETEPSCVGILTNLFMKRPSVLRSWHPTHSVAAIGEDAREYVNGEEKYSTPCPREGCWGKLYDRGAKILFLGANMKKNTIIHGVEEWENIPNRLATEPEELKIIAPDGIVIDRLMYRHKAPVRDISFNYDKLEKPLIHKGIANKGKIGDAISILCDVREMVEVTSEFLSKDIKLFLDGEPIPENWYKFKE